MRFHLILEVNKQAFGDLLPINYQYEQSALIYKILSQGGESYATWLHDNGFVLGNGKRFKLFTFSPLKIEKRQILRAEGLIKILSDTVEWQITFLPERSTEQFIKGLFVNQQFEIGDKQSVVRFNVRQVEVVPSPVYTDEMTFRTMSPLCLRCCRNDGSVQYISPSDLRAATALRAGLISRYKAYYKKPFAEDFDFSFTLLNEPKAKLMKIKAGTAQETLVKGYKCDFKIKAPAELMKMMYEGGIGEQCAIGFGCLTEKKESII